MQLLYCTFLLIKAVLNFGAAAIAFFILKDMKMAGFWLFVGCADAWVGLASLK